MESVDMLPNEANASAATEVDVGQVLLPFHRPPQTAPWICYTYSIHRIVYSELLSPHLK